ncbi:hypothetical protein D9M72_195390 [compost metagenome]
MEACLVSVSVGSWVDTGVGEVSLLGLPSPSASGLSPLTESSRATAGPPALRAPEALTVFSKVPVRPVKLMRASNCTVNCAPTGSTAPSASRFEAAAVPLKAGLGAATVPPLGAGAITIEPGTMVY